MYAKFVKTSKAYAVEESYVVKAGSTVLFTSPSFPAHQVLTNEVCLDASPNNQYTLELRDVSDGWFAGSFLEVYGINGNMVFKNYMTDGILETYALSLYSPIVKGASWKYSLNAPTGWNSLNFDDSAWTAAPHETSVEGTQYYRYPFNGVMDMAAVEMRFLYSEGIVVYINGEEIYRDNMPNGEVTPTTSASGSYQMATYRGVVLSGDVAQVAPSVMSVELHYRNNAGTHLVNFDAWMAFYAPNIPNTKCFLYPETPTLTSSSGDAAKAFNFHDTDSMHVSTTGGEWLRYSYQGDVVPAVNGIRIYAGQQFNAQPQEFGFWGSNTPSIASFTKFVDVTDWSFSRMEYKHAISMDQRTPYRYYDLRVTRVPANDWYCVEAQPLICNVAPPEAIEFEQTSYEAVAKYQRVEIRPVRNDFHNCTIQPALPAGLSLDSNACTVTGIPETQLAATPFTITSTEFGGISGTVTLTVTVCSGTMVHIVRTYGVFAYKEGFTVSDSETEEVIMSAEVGVTRPDNQNWEYSFCAPGPMITIHMESEGITWNRGSFVLVYAFINSEQKELLLQTKYDSWLSLPSTYYVRPDYVIPAGSRWFAKMDSIPSDWSGASTDGWTEGSIGSFPAATTQIQLYKRTFEITSLENPAGFVLLLRYKYGVIVHINGVEVFRNRVEGPLNAASLAGGQYDEVIYRSVSLPIRVLSSENVMDYLHTGQNTIAIATVAFTASQSTSYFDCAMRLMATDEESRVMEFDVASSSSISYASNVFSKVYTNAIGMTTCDSNYLEVTFQNDKREWISSIILTNKYNDVKANVKAVTVKARNYDSEQWVTLKSVTGLTWSTVGQRRKVWLNNSKPFRIYRFENFGSGSETECSWNLQSLDLVSDRMQMTIPALSYEAATIFQNIEMAEVYPSSEYYTDFSITPSLPVGLQIDPANGVISGTTTDILASTTYTITASTVVGMSTTIPFTLTVITCTGGKSLITAVIVSDPRVHENGWRLYEGRGSEGTVLRGQDTFPVSNSLFYLDFCLNHGIYTFQAREYNGDGWDLNTGYRMTIDQGALNLVMGMVPEGVPPVTQETVFSSYLPFQINYDEWKVSDDFTEGWASSSFDDSQWTSMKASEIGKRDSVSTFIRRSFSIPSLDDYSVLNVRVRYGAGLVAYFNNRMVARYNMPSTFDATTTATSVHDTSSFSVFHVLLSIDGAVESSNTMAFELHRHASQTSSEPLAFDATGVFGVDRCSGLLDDMFNVTGTAPEESGAALIDLFDMDPMGPAIFPNTLNAYVQFSSSNLLGTRFNAWGFWAGRDINEWSATVSGHVRDNSEDHEVSSFVRQNFTSRHFVSFAAPLGMMPFTFLRISVDSPAAVSPSIASLQLLYCKSSGRVCPGVGEYPAVSEGQVSPALCPTGSSGYAYRECRDGQLSEVKLDRCVFKAPENLRYETAIANVVVGTSVVIGPPLFDNVITRFYMNDNATLPRGLSLDEQSGVISGVPLESMDVREYVVVGSNPGGVTTASLMISVRVGSCVADSGFPVTPVNEIAVNDCSYYGNYIGRQTRLCALGVSDGEWGKTKGMCVPVVLIVVVILVAVLLIAGIVWILIRSSHKRMAVGGVKGKKMAAVVTEKKEKRDVRV